MNYDHEKAHAAMGAVMDGRRDHATRDESDADWCALVARGRIVARHDDGTRGRYRLDLAIVEHPDLPPGECFALFTMAESTTAYRCRPEDAKAALLHSGAFNLA